MNHLSSHLDQGIAVGNSTSNYCEMPYNHHQQQQQQAAAPATLRMNSLAASQQQPQINGVNQFKTWVGGSSDQQQQREQAVRAINCNSIPMNTYQQQLQVNHNIYDQHYTTHQVTPVPNAQDSTQYLYYSVEPQQQQQQQHHNQHQHQLMDEPTNQSYRTIYETQQDQHISPEPNQLTHYQVAPAYPSSLAQQDPQPRTPQAHFIVPTNHHEIQYMPQTSSPNQPQHLQHQQQQQHHHTTTISHLNHHHQHHSHPPPHNQQLQQQQYYTNTNQPMQTTAATQAVRTAPVPHQHHHIHNHPSHHNAYQQQHQHVAQQHNHNNHHQQFDNLTMQPHHHHPQQQNNFITTNQITYQIQQPTLIRPQHQPPTLEYQANSAVVVGANPAVANAEELNPPQLKSQIYYTNQMDLLPTIKQQEEQQQRIFALDQHQQRQQPVVAAKSVVSSEVLNPNQIPRVTATISSYDNNQVCDRQQQQPQPQQRFVSDSILQEVKSRPVARASGARSEAGSILTSGSLQTSPTLQTSPYPQMIARSKSDLDSADLSSINHRGIYSATTTNGVETTPAQSFDRTTSNHHFQSTAVIAQQQQNVSNTNDTNTNNNATVTTHHYTHPQNHHRSLAPHVPATSAAVISYVKQPREQDFVDMRSSCLNNYSLSQDWLDTISRHLIEHMDLFGICVIDNFLGSLKGECILKEVKQLYHSGQYTRGKLVNNKSSSVCNGIGGGGRGGSDNITATSDTSGVIRNDRVIWIDGCESGCSEINNLIQKLCSVITNSSRLSLYSNNGLDKLVINKRTKAHVACYPGNGTKYIKHVDNPNGDGRVITSIYYLNKDWNTKRDGGLLRMFPAGTNEVANIEPLFDRALFFWSDRRNPHEVLPAYKDRFAITVWYIGENRPT